MSALFSFLLIVQALIAVAMITVILMQRSEGGGLAGGGSPSGMMSARGASDFLTRSTAILATLFVALSILLAALAANTAGPRTIDTSLQRRTPASAPATPAAPSQTSIPGATPQPGQPTGAAPAPAAPAAQGNQSGAPLAQ
ncbi:preprotein translocase subunit SecG [Sphingosinicella sp.]|uniref:preprotein translocase subunit SecG n=1 Tax=Sphingosinicella sp. TaxID=1917971 RepID=UPI0040383728